MELLEWDARSYDTLPLPHKRWGPGAIARLRLSGDETVADLGAGTGRDAEQLLAALPHGRVLAIDGSQQMLTQLRERLAGQLDRVRVLQADLREPLPVTEPVDAVLSVATLSTTRSCSARSPGCSGPGASSWPRRAARATSPRSGPS